MSQLSQLLSSCQVATVNDYDRSLSELFYNTGLLHFTY